MIDSRIRNNRLLWYPCTVTENVEGKFEGTVIFTPELTGEFIGGVLGNYCGEGVVIDGTSQWLDKVGEKVADEKLTVRFDPYDERINMGERATANGFLSEPYTVIEKGVLKTHQLSLYGANKTGRPFSSVSIPAAASS